MVNAVRTTALAISVAVASTMFAQSRSLTSVPQDASQKVQSPGLKVVLVISNWRIVENEPLVIEAKVMNVSDTNISVFGPLLWGYAGGFTIQVFDQAGHAVDAEQHDDDLVSPSELDDRNNYITLHPGEFLGVYRKDSTRNLTHKPGIYDLVLAYRSPVPAHYSKLTNFWGREKGELRSAPVRVEVLAR